MHQIWVVLKNFTTTFRGLLIGLCLLTLGVTAFGNTQDSLMLLLKNKGIVREKVYLELANYYLKTNDTQSVVYAQKVLQSSEAENRSEWRFSAHVIMGQYYLSQLALEQSKHHFLQAQQLASSLVQKAKTDIAMAELSIAEANYYEALEFLRLAKTNIDNNEIGFEVYYFEGICYKMLHEQALAKVRFDNAYKIARLVNDASFLARINYQLGSLFFDQQIYPKAFYHLKQSVQQQGLDTLSNLQGQSFMLIGQIYMLQGEFTRAYKYFAGSAHIFARLKQNDGQAQSQLFMAEVSLRLGQLNNAMQHVKLATLFFDQLVNMAGLADCQLLYAHIFIELNQPESAAEYLQRAMALDQSLFTDNRQYNLYYIMALWQYKTKNFHDAIESLQTALKIAEKNGDFYKLAQTYNTLSDYQYEYGRYKSAVENLQLANTFADSLNHLLHNDELRYMQSEHETSRTQTVIDY